MSETMFERATRLGLDGATLAQVYDRIESLERQLAEAQAGRAAAKELALNAPLFSTRQDAARFKTLIETSPNALCFMGEVYPDAESFRAAIDAMQKEQGR